MASEADEPLSVSDKIDNQLCYKCCKGKIFKGCVCVKCGSAFHQGCAQKYKCKPIDATRILCNSCQELEIPKSPSVFNQSQHLYNKNIDFLTRENELMKVIIKQWEEKYVLLQDNNDLIKQQILNIQRETATYSKKTGDLTNQKNISFADVVKNHSHIKTDKQATKNKNNLNTLLIKSKEITSNTEILNELRNKIQPKERNIIIKDTKLTKMGVLVQCENAESTEVLKTLIATTFDGKLETTENRTPQPQLIIKYVKKEMEHDRLISELSQNNQFINNKNDIKIVKEINGKNFKHIVVKTTPELRNIIINQEESSLKTDWEVLAVQDFLGLIRALGARNSDMFKNIVNQKVKSAHIVLDHTR